jgi:hypothetical protein
MARGGVDEGVIDLAGTRGHSKQEKRGSFWAFWSVSWGVVFYGAGSGPCVWGCVGIVAACPNRGGDD